MPLETASYISGLEPSNPASTDQLSQADDHLRLIKSVLKGTFPNLNAPVTATPSQLNAVSRAVPVGVICIWYGSSSSVPSGWTICNGTTVSLSDGSGSITPPNLSNLTVVGAGSMVAQGATTGAVSSSATTGSAGGHTHTVSGGDHAHTGTVGGTTLDATQIPSHRHYVFNPNNAAYDTLPANPSGSANYAGNGGSSGASYNIGGTTGTDASIGMTSPTGGGGSHNHPLTVDSSSHAHTISSVGDHTHSLSVSTVQPSMGLYYIMKV